MAENNVDGQQAVIDDGDIGFDLNGDVGSNDSQVDLCSGIIMAEDNSYVGPPILIVDEGEAEATNDELQNPERMEQVSEDTDSNPLANLLSEAVEKVENDNETIEINLMESMKSEAEANPFVCPPRDCINGMLSQGGNVGFQLMVPDIVVNAPSAQNTDDEDSEGESEQQVKTEVVRNNEQSVEISKPTDGDKYKEEPDKSTEENEAFEDVPITTLKQTREDDDEFDFELPQKAEVEYDVAPIKAEMDKLGTHMDSLDVFSEGAPVTEPLELLQQQVQKTVTEASKVKTQLLFIQQLVDGVPAQHKEYNQLKSWCGTCEYRVTEVQRLAQIKLSQVLEAINVRKSQEPALQEEYDLHGNVMARDAAQAEWDAVQSITPGVRRPVKVSTIPSVMYTEALDMARTTFNLSQYESVIKTTVPKKGFSGFIHRIFGTKLNKALVDEQKFAFCLAACPYQDDIACQWHILHTIYARLTASAVDAPRFGGHWEQIGFQGNDPATDLRGSGFLGLLQLTYIITDPVIYPLVKEMYKLSLHEVQNFPFCIMGINITRIVVQTFREENLHKECNKRKSVMDVLNDLYIGIWFHVYTIWKNQHKTIRDTGFVMKDAETAARKRPHTLISAVNVHLSQGTSANGRVHEGGEPMEFEPVCDFSEDQ